MTEADCGAIWLSFRVISSSSNKKKRKRTSMIIERVDNSITFDRCCQSRSGPVKIRKVLMYLPLLMLSSTYQNYGRSSCSVLHALRWRYRWSFNCFVAGVPFYSPIQFQASLCFRSTVASKLVDEMGEEYKRRTSRLNEGTNDSINLDRSFATKLVGEESGLRGALRQTRETAQFEECYVLRSIVFEIFFYWML